MLQISFNVAVLECGNNCPWCRPHIKSCFYNLYFNVARYEDQKTNKTI